MRIAARSATLVLLALSLVSVSATAASAQGPCSLFCCFFGSRCGNGCDSGCGCGAPCGMDGRQFAGQSWDGCCEEGPRLCTCRDGCGQCAGGACGGVNSCGSGCEPSCAAEPSCGCASNCNRGGTGCCLFDGLFGCTGCDGEFYWCEWHNDPPRCDNPCDCYGNWIGPSASYRAPYAHAYSPVVSSPPPYYANQSPTPRNPQPMAAPRAYARAQQLGQVRPNNYGASVYSSNSLNANRQPQSMQTAQRYAANRTTRTAPTPIAQRPTSMSQQPVYR